MADIPNICALIDAGDTDEAIAVLTKSFGVTAAIGPRSTKIALEVATRLFAGDLWATIQFMNRRTPILNGDTPMQKAERSEADCEIVLNWIGQIAAGVYI